MKLQLIIGFVLSGGFINAQEFKLEDFYSDNQELRTKTEEVFNTVDFILTPTTPTTAFKIGENINDPITMYLQDIFTVYANLVGNPAISLPVGQHSNGMPFGMQLMGRYFEEKELLAFSKEVMS